MFLAPAANITGRPLMQLAEGIFGATYLLLRSFGTDEGIDARFAIGHRLASAFEDRFSILLGPPFTIPLKLAEV